MRLKNRRQILSRTDQANEVNKTFIIWLLVHISLLCLFSFKSTFSRQNLQIRKKAYCPRTAPGRAIRFFPDLSATNPSVMT